MRISRQIGWSQEANLIYELIQQTERLNQILPGNQAAVRTGISKQIGWSTEANLYYEWLRSLNKLTTHFGCPDCVPTTTTTTTLFPPVPGDTLRIYMDNRDDSYGGLSTLNISFIETVDITLSGTLPDFVTPIVYPSVSSLSASGFNIPIGIYYLDITFSSVNLTSFALEYVNGVAYDFNFSAMSNMQIIGILMSDNKLPSEKVNEVLSIALTYGVPYGTGGAVNTATQIPPAPPTGQGILDKADLQLNSWLVLTD